MKIQYKIRTDRYWNPRDKAVEMFILKCRTLNKELLKEYLDDIDILGFSCNDTVLTFVEEVIKDFPSITLNTVINFIKQKDFKLIRD